MLTNQLANTKMTYLLLTLIVDITILLFVRRIDTSKRILRINLEVPPQQDRSSFHAGVTLPLASNYVVKSENQNNMYYVEYLIT